MNRKIHIGNFEAACLLLNMLTSKIVLDFPRTVAEDAGTAGWIMTVLVSVAAFLLFLLISKLYKRFEGNDLLDLGKKFTGEIGRVIIGLLVLAQFMIIIPIALREFSEDIKVISLTVTPISIIIMLFCIAMIAGAFLGLETLARIHALAIPILALAFVLILALSAPRFDISKIAPWLGLGPEVILKKGISNLSIYTELVVLFLIMPFMHKQSDYNGVGKYVILIAGVFFVLSSISYLLILQYPTATEFFLPMYQLTRSIMIGRFFTRIEAAFILIWASSAFLYLSSGLYFITFIFQKTFGLKERKPLIIPFIILIFTISMIPENLYSSLQIQMNFYRKYTWMVTFFLPLVILIVALIRIKGGRRRTNAR